MIIPEPVHSIGGLVRKSKFPPGLDFTSALYFRPKNSSVSHLALSMDTSRGHETWSGGSHTKKSPSSSVGLQTHSARKIQWLDENATKGDDGNHGLTPTHLLDEEGLDVCIISWWSLSDHPNALLAWSIQASHRGVRTTSQLQGENMVNSTLLHPPHSSLSSQWFFQTNKRWGRPRWIFLRTDKRSLDVSISSAAGSWTFLSAWMLRGGFPRYSLTYTRRAG